jgi:hypothetical protein
MACDLEPVDENRLEIEPKEEKIIVELTPQELEILRKIRNAQKDPDPYDDSTDSAAY